MMDNKIELKFTSDVEVEKELDAIIDMIRDDIEIYTQPF